MWKLDCFVFYTFKFSEMTLWSNYSNFLLVALIAILLVGFNFLCKFHLKEKVYKEQTLATFSQAAIIWSYIWNEVLKCSESDV